MQLLLNGWLELKVATEWPITTIASKLFTNLNLLLLLTVSLCQISVLDSSCSVLAVSFKDCGL